MTVYSLWMMSGNSHLFMKVSAKWSALLLASKHYDPSVCFRAGIPEDFCFLFIKLCDFDHHALELYGMLTNLVFVLDTYWLYSLARMLLQAMVAALSRAVPAESLLALIALSAFGVIHGWLHFLMLMSSCGMLA